MKIGTVERVERTMCLLELGVDFDDSALELNPICPTLLSLKREFLDLFAKGHGFDRWCWVGHYDLLNHNIKVQFEKKIFV